MKTWDILKATYLITLLHISNENTAYLFEISSCINISNKGPNTCSVALRVVRLIIVSSQTKSGTPLLKLHLLDSLMIVIVLIKFEKNLSGGFFRGMTLISYLLD